MRAVAYRQQGAKHQVTLEHQGETRTATGTTAKQARTRCEAKLRQKLGDITDPPSTREPPAEHPWRAWT